MVRLLRIIGNCFGGRRADVSEHGLMMGRYSRCFVAFVFGALFEGYTTISTMFL